MAPEYVGYAGGPIRIHGVKFPDAETGPDYPRRRIFGNVIGELTLGWKRGRYLHPELDYPGVPATYPGGPTDGMVGTQPLFDYWNTIQSQYANSRVLTTWIGCFFDSMDQIPNFDNFYDLVWNVDTAQGYGLDVWGRIVGITRSIGVNYWNYFGPIEGRWKQWNTGTVTLDEMEKKTAGHLLGGVGASLGERNLGELSDGSKPVLYRTWGFESGVPQQDGDVFYNGAPYTAPLTMDDHTYRNAILAKAYANITDGSVASFNRMLMWMHQNRGNIWIMEGTGADVGFFGFTEMNKGIRSKANPWASGFNQYPFQDIAWLYGETMTYTYVSTFPLTPFEQAMLMTSGVMPKPSGVRAYLKDFVAMVAPPS